MITGNDIFSTAIHSGTLSGVIWNTVCSIQTFQHQRKAANKPLKTETGLPKGLDLQMIKIFIQTQGTFKESLVIQSVCYQISNAALKGHMVTI